MLPDNLPFENQLLLDHHTEDALFIFARGLSMEQVFLSHLKLYSTPKALVLVVNTNQADEVYFMDRLAAESDVESPAKLITGDVLVADRIRHYLAGGVQFVTSRVLIVDIITDKLPLHLVSGLLVYRAHKVLHSAQESFILRLFREKKPDGFVKAFTDAPTLIGDGNIGQLQRLVKALYLRKVILVPRNHVDVKEQLEAAAPETVEITVELSPAMRKIQSSLHELIAACLRELKACHPGLVDASEEEAALGASLALHDSAIERRLAQVETDSLSDKTRKMLTDVRFLRLLLRQMEALDPVTFHTSLELLRSNQKEFASNSGWLFTSAAATMFSKASERVNLPRKQPGDSPFEEPPKWAALAAVAGEIRDCQADLRRQQKDLEPEAAKELALSGTVLLLTESREAALQSTALLRQGRRRVLASVAEPGTAESKEPLWDPAQCWLGGWKVFLSWERSGDMENATEEDRKASIEKIKQEQRERLRAKGRKKRPPKRQLRTMDDFIGPEGITLDNSVRVREGKKSAYFEEAKEEEKVEEEPSTSDEAPGDELLVVDYIENQRYRLLRILEALEPNYIILLHCDLLCLRMIELFKARRPQAFLRLYVLQYKESGEEALHLATVSRERQAFEHLMAEKATLALPRTYDTARDPPPLPTQESQASRARRGLPALAEEASERPRVIVDMREFRSQLPLSLYKRGIDVVPVTLEVGDYILTPEVCVERKSHADLAGSLTSGRLYTQAQQMLRHYPTALLLIEGSDEGKSKGGKKRRWGEQGAFSGEPGPAARELRGKLALLTRTVPGLRVVWTPSATASVDLFEELKWEKPQPEATEAAGKLADEEGDPGAAKGSVTLAAMLDTLPGLTSAERQELREKGGSLSGICQLKSGDSEGRFDRVLAFLAKDFR